MKPGRVLSVLIMRHLVASQVDPASPRTPDRIVHAGCAGRPVDLLVMPAGALLVSDDKAGAIYRISYEGEKGKTRAPGSS
jgi:glucose/arabinose dehydrogenase